jgi:hypothetical protein
LVPALEVYLFESRFGSNRARSGTITMSA